MILEASVNFEEALSFLGYSGQIISCDLMARLRRAAKLCEDEMIPRGCYRIFESVIEESTCDGNFIYQTVVEGANFAIESCDLANHIEGCDHVALMAVTLGVESDMVLRRERAVNAIDSLLIDACASSLVEQAADALNAVIIHDANGRGYSCRSRYSPGYGDVSLTCQAELVAACGAEKAIGIGVSDSNMLIPMKSITAIIGLAREGEMRQTPENDPRISVDELDTCEKCRLFSTCSIRGRGRTCYGSKA